MKLKKCPICKCEKIRYYVNFRFVRVECTSCGLKTANITRDNFSEDSVEEAKKIAFELWDHRPRVFEG